VNRSGRFARQLLKDDRSTDSVEVGAVARRPTFVGADLIDHSSKDRIDFPEVGNRFLSEGAGTGKLHFCARQWKRPAIESELDRKS
jgi:hypothetical protein